MDVKSVLEVGCGNGIITNMINKTFTVGIDFAQVPLTQVKTHKVLADIGNLPVKNDKFDLVLLAEVLEHLEEDTYVKAIKEIKRLKPKYLLITVPFEESLEEELCKCSVCGNLFNLSHHYRSLNKNWFTKFFPGYEILKIKYDEFYIPTSKWTVTLKHKFNVYTYSDVAVCNKCGNSPMRSNKMFGIIFFGLRIVDTLIKKALKVRKPYHLMILLKIIEQDPQRILNLLEEMK